MDVASFDETKETHMAETTKAPGNEQKLLVLSGRTFRFLAGQTGKVWKRVGAAA